MGKVIVFAGLLTAGLYVWMRTLSEGHKATIREYALKLLAPVLIALFIVAGLLFIGMNANIKVL